MHVKAPRPSLADLAIVHTILSSLVAKSRQQESAGESHHAHESTKQDHASAGDARLSVVGRESASSGDWADGFEERLNARAARSPA